MRTHRYRRRHFAPAAAAAGFAPGEHTPKDLRDTFASQLLTAGVPLGYVSYQLGHADVAVTARHYAKYSHVDAYVAPPTLAEGGTFVDLLAPREEAAKVAAN